MGASSVRAGQAYIELTTKDAKLVKGLMNAQARLKTFGGGVTALGKQFAALGAAMAAAMGYLTKNFADFDDQMRLVQGITGATDAELATLTETAKKLGRETSYTAAQVAQGMVALSRMGFTVDEINKSMRHFMNLDRATGMNDLGMSAEIAAAAMRSFGLDARDTGRIADVLTATANGSAQTLVDLGEALKMAAPNAHMANATLEDTCAMLGVLANMGIKGSMAGSALAKTFQRLASGKGVDVLEGKGIKTKDANGNLRSMRDILTDIAKVTAKMGTAQKIDFLTKVFDVRGAKGGGVLAGNLKDLDKMIQKIVNSGGAAEETAKKMDSGIGGAFRIFMSALEGVGLEIGNIIGQYIQPYVKAVTGVLGALAEWVKSHREVVISIVRVGAIIGGIGITLLAFGAAIKVAAFACGGLAIAGKMLVGVFTLMKVALVALRTVAITTWGVVTSPMFLFIAAAGLVVGIVWLLTGAFGMLWDSLKSLGAGFSAAFATIRQVAGESFEVIKRALAAGDLAGAAKVGLTALKVVWLAGLLPLKKAWADFKYFLVDSWTIVSGAVLESANNLWYYLLIGLKAIGNGIANAWDALWGGIITAFEATIAYLKKKWIQFKGFFDDDVDVDAEIRKVDEEIAGNRSAREKRRNDARNRREREVRDLNDEREETNRSIRNRTQDSLRENRTERDRAIGDAAKELRNAQREWKDAVNEVNKKASEKKPAVQESKKKIEAGNKKLEAGGPTQAVGDFSARAVLMSLGGNPQERVAKASEKTAENTGKIVTLFADNWVLK